MAKNWYILHIFLGQEKKVVNNISNVLKNGEFASYIGEVKIPYENVWEFSKGKKRKIQKKIFPGYILIELDLPEEGNVWKSICSSINKITGVSGFLGINTKSEKPNSISVDEARKIFQRTGEIKSNDVKVSNLSFSLSEVVKVNDGPFSDFTGVVEEINHEKHKVKVRVEIFGRSTPVELDFFQVESI